jgi:hypothetical protein
MVARVQACTGQVCVEQGNALQGGVVINMPLHYTYAKEDKYICIPLVTAFQRNTIGQSEQQLPSTICKLLPLKRQALPGQKQGRCQPHTSPQPKGFSTCNH